jgi:hypothetical protein
MIKAYQSALQFEFRQSIIFLPARFTGTEILSAPSTDPNSLAGPEVGTVNVQISYAGPLSQIFQENPLHVNIKLREVNGRAVEFGFVPNCIRIGMAQGLQGMGNPNDGRTYTILYVNFKTFATPPK